MSRRRAKESSFTDQMTAVGPAGLIISYLGLATTLAVPCRASEKLPAHPKLPYRQIAAGWTLTLEAVRREKTSFSTPPRLLISVNDAHVQKNNPLLYQPEDGDLPCSVLSNVGKRRRSAFA